MAADKRLCRRKSRGKGQSLENNYHSHAAYLHAKSKLRMQKAGRKAARNGR